MVVTDKSAPAVTLIVAGIGAALGQSGAGSTSGQLVAALAGRGEVQHRWNRHTQMADLYAWQRGLLDTLGLEALRYPSAAVSALGAAESGTGVDGCYWMHADPVHLVAGLDRLTLQPLSGAASVTEAERQLLQPLIRDHLRQSRWQLASSGLWLLRAEQPLQATTTSPESAAVNPLEEVMPRGFDAAELRRSMTEWQMVLHEHPVSEARARRGLPAINALWPWGGGVLSTVARSALPTAFASDAFTRGVYRMHGGAEILPLPENAGKVAGHATTSAHTLAVLQLQDLAALERDWLAPLEQALRNNVIRQLDLVLDEWHIRVTRGMLRRFWRKPLPPADWPE